LWRWKSEVLESIVGFQDMAALPGEITLLLADLNGGNRAAENRLAALVYRELRVLAARYMKRERADHTLQPTAIVDEAFLRLTRGTHVDWQGRGHFFALAAQAMRRILVDHARSRNAERRGGPLAQKVSLENAALFEPEQSLELLALDEALTRLAEFDERQSRIVESRFFCRIEYRGNLARAGGLEYDGKAGMGHSEILAVW
jgi:RNA polymerase sigma-70 factor (ECF subfamily)